MIAEGKTKIILEISPGQVFIKNKDDITAGDGAKRDVLKNKAVFSTTTTSNCFRLLNEKGIHTHFIKQVEERTFKARRLEMIPIELVSRRIATGSYLNRNLEVKEGTIFDQLVIEFFLKDDARHDPLMVWDEKSQRFKLYSAKLPILSESYIGDLSKDFPQYSNIPEISKEIKLLSRILIFVFTILENAWTEQKVTLVDLKIECGYDAITGEILVGDVIDNDSWRIWPYGDKSQMKDKQVYRNLNETTTKALKDISKNYAWVAKATSKFFL